MENPYENPGGIKAGKRKVWTEGYQAGYVAAGIQQDVDVIAANRLGRSLRICAPRKEREWLITTAICTGWVGLDEARIIADAILAKMEKAMTNWDADAARGDHD